MELASLIFGTYIITLVLTESEGAYGGLYKLRQNKKVDDFGILNCFMCTAFWIALLFCSVTGNLGLLFIVWGASTALDKVVK